MKKLQKIFALTAALAMFANPVFSQAPGYNDSCYSSDNNCYSRDNGCYNESCCASDWATYLAVGAVVVAGAIVLIATNRGHHHSDTTTTNTHATTFHATSCSF